MESPQEGKEKRPRHRPKKRPAQGRKYLRQIFTVGYSCKNASDFPARKQLAVKSASEPRLPDALENDRYLLGNRQIINTAQRH
ncbi:hypothetical protein GQ457_06G011310 [Hibiscus cannabinus]